VKNLEGKVAMVTGAKQGIGQALALSLAKAGARIVASDITHPTETIAAIQAEGGFALGCEADVTDNDSLQASVAAAEAEFGPINILINNAGLFSTIELKPMLEITEEEFDQVMRVNVRGLFQATKAVVPSMRRANGGSIINIGSGTMHRGAPLFAHYVASKGAVFSLSRSMAREFAESGIRVNCITVGFTASKGVLDHPEMMEKFSDYTIAARMIKREMVPEDLSGTVVYLASDASAFVTGQALNVDGGAVTY